MKRLLLLCLLCMAFANAQTLKGTIKDAATGETLPYVNIGVLNRNIGTVSDEDGKFAFAIPEGHAADTVRISMIGYATRDVSVSQLQKELAANPVLKLKEEAVELPQVVVSNKKARQKLLGNKTKSQSTTVGFKDNRLGYEIGMIMRIKGKTARLKTFSASVASTNNPNVKLRLNFYSLKKGKPHQLIIDRNIIVNAPKENGKLVVDLMPYNIMVEDDFFVSLEWIESAPGRLEFSAGIMATPMWVRGTSQSTWEKVGMAGVGFTVDTDYW